MYSRLNASASARVRSASFIFLSFSVTSSTRPYTKSRIAARTASERLGKSSTCTRKSSAFRYRAGRRSVIFSVSASRISIARPRMSNRPRLTDACRAAMVPRYITIAGPVSEEGTPVRVEGTPSSVVWAPRHRKAANLFIGCTDLRRRDGRAADGGVPASGTGENASPGPRGDGGPRDEPPWLGVQGGPSRDPDAHAVRLRHAGPGGGPLRIRDGGPRGRRVRPPAEGRPRAEPRERDVQRAIPRTVPGLRDAEGADVRLGHGRRSGLRRRGDGFPGVPGRHAVLERDLDRAHESDSRDCESRQTAGRAVPRRRNHGR